MLDFNAGSLDWGELEKNLGANVLGAEKKNFKDDRFWSLSRDENDNGGAIIRLLPDPTGVPFIQRYSHAFQSFDKLKNQKRWYINISPQTVNLPCPAADLWSAIYGLGTDEAKLEAKNFSRKIKFLTNILVIKDPANPANEGKIFLWEFGTKLKDKFMAALNPTENERAMGEEPKQLFNPLNGCNIKLKIAKVAGYLNYDGTEIMPVSSAYPDAETAKSEILEKAHKLEEFQKPENFESYEELKSKMKYVLEKYQPKNIDAVTFNDVVQSVLGAGTKTETPTQQASTSEPVSTETPVETPVQTQEPKKEEPKPASTNDDLAFLDDL